ncbi:MAG TPA: hypothetical protein VFB69_07660 [Candidatus Dormibacteraeota bacterium]|nr:hypothetical protein [Candidatus Dormibacteraeota bacterium]
MDDVLIHLVMSEPRDQAEIDRLFQLDEALDDSFPDDYDGNEIGLGEFVIHLRHKDGERLLNTIRPRLPKDLVRPGSYVVIRRTARDEVTERVVPLAGQPKLAEALEPVRRAISFGGIFDETVVNKALCDYLHRLWPRVAKLPPCADEAAEVAILWWIAGDISSAPIETIRTRLQSRSKRTLTVKVPIPQQERTAQEVDGVVRDSLATALDQCDRLIKRRRLDWDLQPARDAIARLMEPA